MENTYKIMVFVSKDGLFLEDWEFGNPIEGGCEIKLTPNLLKSKLILVEEIDEAKVDGDKLLADTLGLDIVEFTISCVSSEKIHKHNPENKQSALEQIILKAVKSMLGEDNA